MKNILIRIAKLLGLIREPVTLAQIEASYLAETEARKAVVEAHQSRLEHYEVDRRWRKVRAIERQTAGLERRFMRENPEPAETL